MGFKFWLTRSTKVYLFIAITLLVVELIKGHAFIDALSFSLLWSLITTAIFITTRIYHLSKGRECQLCQDSPKNDIE